MNFEILEKKFRIINVESFSPVKPETKVGLLKEIKKMLERDLNERFKFEVFVSRDDVCNIAQSYKPSKEYQPDLYRAFSALEIENINICIENFAVDYYNENKYRFLNRGTLSDEDKNNWNKLYSQTQIEILKLLISNPQKTYSQNENIMIANSFAAKSADFFLLETSKRFKEII